MPRKVYSIKGIGGKTTYVTIERYDKNTVALVVCGKNGRKLRAGHIAMINGDGISLCTSLTADSNLPRDCIRGYHIKLLNTR